MLAWSAPLLMVKLYGAVPPVGLTTMVAVWDPAQAIEVVCEIFAPMVAVAASVTIPETVQPALSETL